MNTLPQHIPAALRAAAAAHPERAAIVDAAQSISYRQVVEQAEACARALLAQGCSAGERIAIWAPNMAHWIIAACGAHMIGAAIVPINTRMKAEEVRDILHRSGARLLFCVGHFLDAYYPAILDGQHPPTLQGIVVMGGGEIRESELSWTTFIARGNSIDIAEVAAHERQLRAETTADLMFTSGTTGRPKGVMYAHGPMIRAFSEWARVVGLRESARYLIVNPFFHSFGYRAGWVAAFLTGATVYPHQIFDAEAVLQRIARERINFLPGPPTLYQSMLAHPRLKAFDLSSLHAAVTGAATIPPVLIARMRDELGIARVTTAYGLTECGGCATVCDPDDSVETIASTCGKALPGTEIRCVDAAGNTVAAGSPGEVLLRGYHVMQGYFEDEQGSRDAIDADGWLHTGDIGVINAEGYLKITDRLKDMFIVGGFNAYPAEIERQLATHPEIAQVAVIGVPEPRLGEVGCAYVVLRHDANLNETGLLAWAREHMANYKAPRFVRLVDALPLNASAKVDKKILRARWRDSDCATTH